MLIRTRLLLLGLATLALPWAGCQYAREMEVALRSSERQSLLAIAETIATSLQGRRDLLSRNADGAGSAEPPGPYDLEPVPLRAEPELDARAEEWPVVKRAWKRFASPERGRTLEVLAGSYERHVYLLIRSNDPRLVFDRSDSTPLDSDTIGDRLWLGFTDAAGENRQVFIAAGGSGAVRGRRIETADLGRSIAVEERRVEGAWQRTKSGWQAELRIPLSMLGGRLGVLVDDRDRRGETPVSYGSLRRQNLVPVGRLFAADPDLSGYLARFRQSGVRIVAATTSGAVVAETSALSVPSENSPSQALLSQVYRRFMQRTALAERVTENERGRLDDLQARDAATGRSSSALLASGAEGRLIVTAVAPVFDADRSRVIGVLQVAQTADRWLVLRDRALTRLLNLTLGASAFVMLATFLFGLWLARRLGRLRAASERSLQDPAGRSALPVGRLAADFPDTQAADELGDVSRSFSLLLARLDEYTHYLRTLAGKLAHEIRTPLAILRSSLDNLETEPVSPTARTYLARAREGSERLHGILTAMGAASRVEESIQGAERISFDLAAMLRDAIGAYRMTFAQHEFVLVGAEQSCTIDGAPDLIMQMFDKLIDNAVDFSTKGTPITITLLCEDRDAGWAALSVENLGPPLPPNADSRLFESLWQSRTDSDARPHFGLGLYIVRLIAEFHGGRPVAETLEGERGARFTVRLRRQTLPE